MEKMTTLTLVNAHFHMTNKLFDDFKMLIQVDWNRQQLEKAVKFFMTKYENNLVKNSTFQFIHKGKKLADN